PDVRELIRGTVNVMENLLPYRELGIPLPKVRTLANCMDYTALARKTLAELAGIIQTGRYSRQLPEGAVSLLSTQIYDLNIYKQGHAAGQPVHRLEKESTRRSDSALVTMHSLACELFPECKQVVDGLLANGDIRQ